MAEENPFEPPRAPLVNPVRNESADGLRSMELSSGIQECPHCHHSGSHYLVEFTREKFGCRHLVVFLAMGIVPYILWTLQRSRPHLCSGCEKVFYARTKWGKIALFLLIFLLALLVIALVRELRVTPSRHR